MTRTTLWVAALATSAVTALAAGAAIADDTTIVREHREVQAPAPAPPPAPVTTTVQHTASMHSTTSTADRAYHPRHVVRRHHVAHHAATTTVAQKRTETTVTPTAAPVADQPAAPAAAIIDRKTVIHRDDNGDVSRHTVIQKQDPDGTQTTIEHHSHTDADDVPPHG